MFLGKKTKNDTENRECNVSAKISCGSHISYQQEINSA